MIALLASRRRMIAARGFDMTLTRGGAPSRVPPYTPAAGQSVQLRGVQHGFTAEQIHDAVQQGDQQVEILNDEISSAAWPGPPRTGDVMTISGATWRVVGNMPLLVGVACIGHRVWVRGGQ